MLPSTDGASKVAITLRINDKDTNFALTHGQRSSIASVRPVSHRNQEGLRSRQCGACTVHVNAGA